MYSDAKCSLLVSSYSFGNPNADVTSPLNTYNEVCVDVSAGQNVTNSISSVNVTCPYLGTTNGAPYYNVHADTFSSPSCASDQSLVYSAETTGPVGGCVRSFFTTPGNSSLQPFYVIFSCSPTGSSNDATEATLSRMLVIAMTMFGVIAIGL